MNRKARLEQARAQNRAIAKARGKQVAPGPQQAPTNYMIRKGYLLVRDEYREEVERILEAAGFLGTRGSRAVAPARPGRPRRPRPDVVHGVRLLRLDGNPDTFAALDVIRYGYQELPGMGPGVAAPDHLVSICGESGPCPATEPFPPKTRRLEPLPTPDRSAGQGVRIVIVDTGIDRRTVSRTPWLQGVRGDKDEDVTKSGDLINYAGHGTFIASMVRMVAPRAEVIVRRAFGEVGSEFESQVVQKLDEVLRRDHPDIISLSAGTFAFDPTGLLSFEMFFRNRLRHHKGVALIAAVGNQGKRRAFWPAAAPWTVSVGSLDRTWRRRAKFSNYGGWVDVYAPGEDLVNVFPTGKYRYREPPHAKKTKAFTGWARWSGTSFSTPLVAGLVAARMWRTGENGRTAAQALLAEARIRHQYNVGAVLLPL
jgi:hypothetical protein